MEDLLIEVLETFGYPVFVQGSLLENDTYPDSFFTFWNVSSNSSRFYDDDEHAILYIYDVNAYSTDPEKVYSMLRDAKTALKTAGFIVSGDGHSVVSDEPTHDGRGMTVQHLRNV